jgi:hypothetical protein
MKRTEVLIIVVGLVSMLATWGLSFWPGVEFGEAWIRNTARASVLWYWAAMVTVLGGFGLKSQDQSRERISRWLWSWGAIVYWLHVVVAFHYYHHWSHEKAFTHVEKASSFGPGIYVSYFFTVLWAVDALWWWLAASSYRSRPRWLSQAIHGFMLFIVFNATLIFERGLIQWIGAAIFLSLGWLWWKSRRADAR